MRTATVQSTKAPDIRFRLFLLLAFRQWGIAIVHNETKAQEVRE